MPPYPASLSILYPPCGMWILGFWLEALARPDRHALRNFPDGGVLQTTTSYTVGTPYGTTDLFTVAPTIARPDALVASVARHLLFEPTTAGSGLPLYMRHFHGQHRGTVSLHTT